MSDCGTRAFVGHNKPDMSDLQISWTHKTCATCANCEPCEWACMSKSSGIDYLVDTDDIWCDGEGYVCKGTINQHFEKLEQVAREMFDVIVDMESEIDEENEKKRGPSPMKGAVARLAKRKLEALGVSVYE